MPKFAVKRFCLIITILTLLVIVTGCRGRGGSTKEERVKTAHFSESLGPVTVPGASTVIVTMDNVISTDGSVHEFIFDSPGLIAINKINSESAEYYSYDSDTGTVSWSDSLPFEFWRYYVDLIVGNYTLGATIPMIHTAKGYFPGGEYRFALENLTANATDVDIYHINKEDLDFSSGELDINLIVFNAGGQNQVVKDKEDAMSIKAMLDTIFNKAGISIGNVSLEFRDEPLAIGMLVSEESMWEFLKLVSAGTAGRKDVGINCFLVPHLPGSIIGAEGSVPGPGFQHGARGSGVLAMAAEYGFSVEGYTEHEVDQIFLAQILAHEIGHYLGLFHTTESSGTYHDPFDDTAECGEENDKDGDGRVSPFECTGKGAENLMFWSMNSNLMRTGNFQHEVSTMQGQTMNTNPSVL